MKRTVSVYLISLLSLCVSVAKPAFPTPMTSLLDAASSEAGVINIESQTKGPPNPWAIGDAALGATGNNFTVDSPYAGRYLNSLQSMGSGACEVSRFSGLTISSPDGTGALGSTWGASDHPGKEGAYIPSNNLLDSCQLPPTNASNAGNDIGMGFTAKDYDYLIAASDNYDWMFTVLTLYGCDVASGALRKTC